MSEKASPKPRPQDESLKETFESIIIAFILAFVFRAYVVEAFVIPTGSMAPTLLGTHVRVDCSQCGYMFYTDWPNRSGSEDIGAIPNSLDAICPMCHFPNPLRGDSLHAESAAPRPGDRILVHKFIYSVSEPRRWDVVVFKDPKDPDTNFIKRLVGLPDESLWIIDGNVYTRKGKDESGTWKIARKSDRMKVQQAVWQPLYHSRYVPLDGGKLSSERRSGWNELHGWSVPWVATRPDNWQIDGQRSYQHKMATPGAIRFSFKRAEEGTMGPSRQPIDWYTYNQFRQSSSPQPIEDVRIAAGFMPDREGLSVSLSTTSRLDDPDVNASDQTLIGAIDSNGKATLAAVDKDGNSRLLDEADVGTFTPGLTRDVELWYVDQHAMLWVDGDVVCQWAFELPIESLVKRAEPNHRPEVTINVTGSPVTLHRVQLDRDLYYSVLNYGGLGRNPNVALGGLHKFNDERYGEPVYLEPDRFYCLGDHSPASLDSRFWSSVDDWVEYRMLRESEQKEGVVPRDLMIGRAFFVYFPAPLAYSQSKIGFFVNFGELRFIH